MNNIIADVCAFANTNGGTIYVGVSADPKEVPVGVSNVQETMDALHDEIIRMISPTMEVEIDSLESQGKTVIRIQVPSGTERPYAIDDNKIYVRDDDDTSLAVRDEIVSLVIQGRGLARKETAVERPPAATSIEKPEMPPMPTIVDMPNDSSAQESGIKAPRGGVEIVGTEQRNDTRYHVLRDLRNGNIVKNVTRSSARRLWHYAISQQESNPVRADKVQWHGDIGLWRRYQKGGETRYDLVQRENGKMRVYYGVPDSAMEGEWQVFLAPEEAETEKV
jgi:hypothetical protein